MLWSMNRNALLVVLGLAILLGAGVLLSVTLRGGGGQAGGAGGGGGGGGAGGGGGGAEARNAEGGEPIDFSEPLLDLDPADVGRITVTEPSGSPRTVLRTARGWALADDLGGAGWPVDPARPGELLRALASAELLAAADEPPPEGGSVTLEVASSDGSASRRIAVGTSAVAGRVAVGVEGRRPVLAGAELLRFVSDPADWRARAAFPTIDPRAASEVVLAPRGGPTVRLDRRGRAWTLRAPATARASADAVDRALGALAGLRVARFIDDPELADDLRGFDRPLTITLADDRRTARPDGSVETERRTARLVVGPPVGAGGATTLALVRLGDAEEGLLVELDASPAALVPARAEAYLAPTAGAFDAAEAAGIELTPPADAGSDRPGRQLVRSLGAWTDARTDRPADRADVDALLDFLRTTPGEPALVGDEAPEAGAGRLRLLPRTPDGDVFDAPAALFDARAELTPAGLTLTAPPVRWTYPDAAPPALLLETLRPEAAGSSLFDGPPEK